MQTATVQYKLIKKIKDERLDVDQIHHYHLLINTGINDLQLAVVDSSSNRILLLEDYALPNNNTSEDLLATLEQIFDAHALVKAGFWKQVNVAVKNQKFIQVPAVLYDEKQTANYLQFNAAIHPDKEDFMGVSGVDGSVVTAFAVPKELRLWLSRIYPSNQPVFVHQSAALVEGILRYGKNRSDNPLYLYIDRFKFHIIHLKEGKLVYYNQFAIRQFSDYIHYIMLVLKLLGIDQRTGKIVLWGYLGKNSPHYREFNKYISNVTFGDRPSHLRFGYMFDEVQDHYFFDLYSLYLIGSKK